MRTALAFLLALVIVACVGCAGDDEPEPIPLAERVVNESDAPGTSDDPEEQGETITELDAFLTSVREGAVDPVEEELEQTFGDAGFVAAVRDFRYYGDTHRPGTSPHVASQVIQLGSEEDAEAALEWLRTDSLKPCPGTCAIRVDEFDVDGISDGHGIRRSQTAEDIATGGREGDRPFESYLVGFTEGPIVYGIDVFGPPGSVTEEQAEEIANALHDRVDGMGPPE